MRDSRPDQYCEEGASCKVEIIPSDRPSSARCKKGRMSPAKESLGENVDSPFTRGKTFREGSADPPRSSYSDHETEYQSYATCPNHQVCPNTVPSHIYAALAPLATYLPVKPRAPVLATLTLVSFAVFWTIATSVASYNNVCSVWMISKIGTISNRWVVAKVFQFCGGILSSVCFS